MSYFSDFREQNYAANKAAIATHKTLSPYADYEGGKYEPMQYEGANMNPIERWHKIGLPSELERIERLKAGYQTEDTEWMESHEALEDAARRENERQG